MRFPKQELDINQYLQVIDNLLKDEECHLFIDTNIISQLYKLNDAARTDFFTWVETVANRFHIPNWTVHEYQKRYCSQKTEDYLTELNNKETVKKLENFSIFAKGYVSDSLLVGSEYQGHKDLLFAELDDIATKFRKINSAIKKNLSEHQRKVHSGILQNLQPYTLDTDIYSILEDIEVNGDIRYSHLVPPGFGDIKKDENKFGDLVIWNEILDYSRRKEIKKVIWITRDGKTDMVYTPQKQVSGGRPVPDKDKIATARESLVYEFSLNTSSDEFYLINFLALVKSISSTYQDLAISFQIVTTPDVTIDDGNKETEEHETESEQIQTTPQPQGSVNENAHQNIPVLLYSNDALADVGYTEKCADPFVKNMIVDFKSHNWYNQNDAAKFLMQWQPTVDVSTVMGRDMMFVLGRNIYQSAVGTSNDSIRYLNNLPTYVQNWDEQYKQKFIDGMLYEVFFNSHGVIRPKEFKTRYFDVILRQIDNMGLAQPYNFINISLSSSRQTRFTPEVRTDKHYTFEFSFASIDKFGLGKTSALKIDDRDESETFKQALAIIFAGRDDLKDKLSVYYAIPKDKIEITGLGDEVTGVTHIGA